MIFDISRENNEQIVEIIDGQQRFTTIMICLIAARNYARNALKSIEAAMIEQNHIVHSVAYQKHKGLNRLQPSNSIREIFDEMCKFEWNGVFPETITTSSGNLKQIKRQVARVEPVYKYAYEQIQNYAGDDSGSFEKFMEQLHHHTYIVRIGVHEKSEAFEIFERTNARGEALEVSDLLKNYLFSKQDQLSEDMENVWDEIATDAGSNLLRLLKYFYMSKVGRVSSRDLYRKLRDHAHDEGISNFVRDLKRFSTYYRCFHSKDPADLLKWCHEYIGLSQNDMYAREIVRSCNALKTFRITQAIPLFYAAVEAYRATPPALKSEKHLINLFRLVESHHFISNRICNRIGNDVEALYAGFCLQFGSDESFKAVAENFEKEFSEKTAKKDEYIPRFSLLSYQSQNDRITIRYIFDLLANKGMKDGQRIPLMDYYNIENGIQSSYNIEHLFSQSIASEGEDFIHEIGNLLIIPKQINGILQNDPFPLKIDKLSNPQNYANKIVNVPPYLSSFLETAADKAEWGQKEINTRTAELAVKSYVAAREFHY